MDQIKTVREGLTLPLTLVGEGRNLESRSQREYVRAVGRNVGFASHGGRSEWSRMWLYNVDGHGYVLEVDSFHDDAKLRFEGPLARGIAWIEELSEKARA